MTSYVEIKDGEYTFKFDTDLLKFMTTDKPMTLTVAKCLNCICDFDETKQCRLYEIIDGKPIFKAK